MPDSSRNQLRFQPPQPGTATTLVVRPRLNDQLRGGIGSQVTLISGGPGFGKTTAVATWAGRGAAAPGVVAWLTVNSADNDLSTMWSDVLGALTVSGAVPAGSPLREITPAAAFGDRGTAPDHGRPGRAPGPR